MRVLHLISAALVATLVFPAFAADQENVLGQLKDLAFANMVGEARELAEAQRKKLDATDPELLAVRAGCYRASLAW